MSLLEYVRDRQNPSESVRIHRFAVTDVVVNVVVDVVVDMIVDMVVDVVVDVVVEC